MNHLNEIKIEPCKNNFDYLLTLEVWHVATPNEYVTMRVSAGDLENIKEAIESVTK